MPEPIRKLIAPFASLRLTVVVLALLMLLIFFGTWAQRTRGIWWVMDEYFTSWGLWVPFDIFAPVGKTIGGAIPFPGGATLGLVMLINLLAAHSMRFKLKARGLRLVLGTLVTLIGAAIIVWFQSWGVITPLKASVGVAAMLAVGFVAYLPALVGAYLLFGKRFGIVLIHLSLILLIVGEGVTRSSAVETQMPIYEGQTLQWSHDIREAELAVIAPREDGEVTERVIVFPQAMLEAAAVTGKPLTHPELPFDVVVEQWMINSLMAPYPQGMQPPPDLRGLGRQHALLPRPEASGVGEQLINLPGAMVRILHDGHDHGRYALSTFTMVMGDVYRFLRQDVPMHDGEPWRISLRFKRYYKPYTFTLLAFHHDLYPGTEIPSNYASDIRIHHLETGEQREVKIKMNHPLRYEGETFFQSGYIQGDLGTVLQVVRNPGSTMPYIACALGGIGLLAHFVISLARHLGKGRDRKAVAA
ncbi:MAG: hypothetical protein GVY24_04690 [Planctomycetes bacterium]|jgi:hypothetical protein|nr:hypothetical protein [Planctomycetota bacterium]